MSDCCGPFIPPTNGSSGGGGGGGGGGIYAIPEKWNQNAVAAGQTDVVVPQLVSTNFDDTQMIQAGSIVGMGWRLSSPVTDGTLTVTVTINGVAATLSGSSTSGSNPSGGQVSQASGVDSFVAGDLVGIFITTTGDFEPHDATNIEIWLLVQP